MKYAGALALAALMAWRYPDLWWLAALLVVSVLVNRVTHLVVVLLEVDR
jgi:hypothetical protein